MSQTVEQKCDCADCVCIVTVENAVKADNHVYCSEACSTGHLDGKGCGHNCGCEGSTKH